MISSVDESRIPVIIGIGEVLDRPAHAALFSWVVDHADR